MIIEPANRRETAREFLEHRASRCSVRARECVGRDKPRVKG